MTARPRRIGVDGGQRGHAGTLALALGFLQGIQNIRHLVVTGSSREW
jgi:hypothetical protein